ncbi:MAG: hypothetical protein D6731_11490 [Planctomycetota bacterium]|nr:MAG: hypothetical protein D6731_11490 [Planctomycetota bacterium]
MLAEEATRRSRCPGACGSGNLEPVNLPDPALETGDPRPGDLLGEFRILRLVGQGAMGKVYEARQESLQRRVALKILPAQEQDGDPQAVRRFYREARAAARLRHPNIVPVYGFGVERGVYFYAMEFVQGRSLHELVHDPHEPLRDERSVAKYVLQVALALDVAHEEGVIHRDVKPANILVRPDGQAAITDFGLSRLERSRSITQEGALMGTPVYMAPEQARGERVDKRIDVYALGVCLYEGLTGSIPFPQTTLRELLVAITTAPPTPPRQLRPDLSPDLEAITLKALAKDPEERYASAKELGDDLIRYFRGDVVAAREVGPLVHLGRRLRKHKLATALGASLAVVLLATGLAIPRLAGDRAKARAKERLAAARELLSGPLEDYRSAQQRVAEAVNAREEVLYRVGARGRAESERTNRAVVAARVALRRAEAALLDGEPTARAQPLAARAESLLGEVLALLPAEDPLRAEASRLYRALLLAQESRARRRGELELAALRRRERLALGDAAPDAAGPTLLTVVTDPPARVELCAVGVDARGEWREGAARLLSSDRLREEGVPLRAGEYVLTLRAPGRIPVRVPLVIQPGRAHKRVRLELPREELIPAGMVYLPPGEVFLGGDPEAVRPLFRQRQPVWVPGFFLARHELTVAEYLDYLRSLPPDALRLPRGGQVLRVGGELRAAPGAARQPVVGVLREDARAYCTWRSERDPRGTYRLPTSAEWEKAARGPAGRAFPWGEGFDPTDPPAHMQRGQGGPLPVGSMPRDRSIYELLDLGGNASEWVDDRFGGNADAVLRGGSWERAPEITRSASREPVAPAAFPAVARRAGFRVAFDPR